MKTKCCPVRTQDLSTDKKHVVCGELKRIRLNQLLNLIWFLYYFTLISGFK